VDLSAEKAKKTSHQRTSTKAYLDLLAGTHHRRKPVDQTRLRVGVAALVLGRRQLSLYLFTTTLGKLMFQTSRDLYRARPTTMLREARSTTMDHHSRGNPVVNFLVVGSLVWNVTNKCVNRVCREPNRTLEWKPGLGDLATISQNRPWSRLCRSEHPATASSIAQCLHAYTWKIKKTSPRLLSNVTRTRSLNIWEGRLDRSCQMMRSRRPGLSSRLLCQSRRNSNRTAKLWER